MRKILPLLAATLVLAGLAGPAGAADSATGDTEARLRDALRQAITQQRALEDAQAALQARQSELEKERDALRQQVDTLSKGKGAPDQAQGEAMAAEFNRRLAAQNEQAVHLNETLEKWKAAYTQAAEIARAKEAERVRLAGEIEGLGKRATTCEAKNVEMFKVGNEILDHLKDIDVAEAMEAHEPFVGTKRVELQNLAQDELDKLLDQKAAQ